MQYILSTLSFVGVLCLLRWGDGMPWLFAIIAGIAWGTAVWSWTVFLKSLRSRKEGGGAAYLNLYGVLLNAAGCLGLTALEELNPDMRSGLFILLFGLGMAGMGLGYLGGASLVAVKEKRG